MHRLPHANLGTFRSLHFKFEKSTGTTRIVTLGDSYTWGDRIKEPGDLWPSVLEKSLHDKSRVEVVNLAIAGFNTVNQRELLSTYGWRFQPDIVIVQYLGNDPLPGGPGFKRAYGSWMKKSIVPLAVSPALHRKLETNSYLYSYLNEKWQQYGKIAVGKKDITYLDLHDDDFSGWHDVQKALTGIRDECAARKKKFLLVMFPLLEPRVYLDKYEFAVLHQKLAKFAAAEKIEFFDLLPELVKINPWSEHWRVEPFDGHPSILCHHTAGTLVAQKLVELGWIGE